MKNRQLSYLCIHPFQSYLLCWLDRLSIQFMNIRKIIELCEQWKVSKTYHISSVQYLHMCTHSFKNILRSCAARTISHILGIKGNVRSFSLKHNRNKYTNFSLLNWGFPSHFYHSIFTKIIILPHPRGSPIYGNTWQSDILRSMSSNLGRTAHLDNNTFS